MAFLTGFLVLAMLAAESPTGPGQGAVTTQFRVLEMDGLDWREAVHDQLTHVGQHGNSTIWTAPRSVVETLVSTADKVVAAPQVTSNPVQPARVSAQITRHYVARLGRVADGPINQATAVAFQPDVQRVNEGIDATISCRALDQGVLAQVSLSDTWLIALHTAKFRETVTPDEEGLAKGHQKATVGGLYQVPEVASTKLDGEWLIPDDGVLILSLGTRTVSGKTTLLGTPARVRERLMLIETESRDALHAAQVPAAHPAVAAANQPLPTAIPHPLAPVAFGQVPACTPASCAAHALESHPAPIFSTHPVETVQVLPYPGVPIRMIVPAAVPTPPVGQGRVMIGIGAHTYTLLGNQAPPLPVPVPLIHLPRATPIAPCEIQKPVDPASLAAAPRDRQVVATSKPARVLGGAVNAAIAGLRTPQQANEAEAIAAQPSPPSRHLPEAFDTEGAPVKLPPLPDETAEALARDERLAASTEPRPSPQSRVRGTTEPRSLAFTESGTVELKGRVSIRTEEGLVIEADSIVLKPPAQTVQARGDVMITPASATTVSASVTTAPAAVPATCCQEAKPTAEACPIAEPCCPAADQVCPVSDKCCPKPCCPSVKAESARGASACQESGSEKCPIAAVVGELRTLTPRIVADRLLTSKGIDPETGECHTQVLPGHPARLAAILASVPGLGGSCCDSAVPATDESSAPVDSGVVATGHQTTAQTTHERLYRIPVGKSDDAGAGQLEALEASEGRIRIPVGKGWIELKIQVGRVTRPVTAGH